MGSRRRRTSKHFRILGYRVRRTRFYGLVSVILLLPGVFLLVIFALLRSDGSGALPVESAERGSTEEESEVPASDLAALLWRHRQATGLKDTSSLTMHGSYLEDGRAYEMALSIRAPGMMRKKLRDSLMEAVLVLRGNSGQIRKAGSEGVSTVETMGAEDLYKYTLLLEGSALRLAEGAPQNYYNYKLLPAQAGEGARTILSTGSEGISLTHRIDGESGLELERSMVIWADGTKNELRLVLEDQRQVEGAVLPYRYRLEINGTERAEIRVQSLQLNPVIPEWFFALESEGEKGSSGEAPKG